MGGAPPSNACSLLVRDRRTVMDCQRIYYSSVYWTRRNTPGADGTLPGGNGVPPPAGGLRRGRDARGRDHVHCGPRVGASRVRRLRHHVSRMRLRSARDDCATTARALRRGLSAFFHVALLCAPLPPTRTSSCDARLHAFFCACLLCSLEGATARLCEAG